ncbi:MAG: biopolymer transporter ExbD [Proteobacteria bacterium]|nr:biopolymer transporter ExbD [Pseudomonadota bacterium]
MAGFVEDSDDVIAAINITPFVDIMLVLLIIFMVTSSYIARASMQVELPRAASAGEAVESTINIIVDKEGELSLNGTPASADAIARKVRLERRQNAKVQAVIAADKGVSYGRVMAVIDLVKQNGVTSFALDIEREST